MNEYLLDDHHACKLSNEVGRTVLGWYIQQVDTFCSNGDAYNVVKVRALLFQEGIATYDEMIDAILGFEYK
jgi:hypothetical protein